VLGYALASYCDAIAGPAHSEERLATAGRIVDLAISAKNPELELLGRRLRVVALLELGDLSGMADEVDRFAATAHELRHPLFQWCVPVWRGTLALVAGRLDESGRLCERAGHWRERAGSVNAALVVEVQGMQRRVERGEFVAVARGTLRQQGLRRTPVATYPPKMPLEPPRLTGRVDERNAIDGGHKPSSAGVYPRSGEDLGGVGVGLDAMRRSGVRIPSAPPNVLVRRLLQDPQ